MSQPLGGAPQKDGICTMSTELTLYRDLLGEIKSRVRTAQHKAALSANAEMILLYWDIGRMIAARQEREGWGAGVIPRLAVDLKNELPEEKGFSERNIKLMVQFYQTYSDTLAIGQPPVAQMSDGNAARSIGQRPVAPAASDSYESTCRAKPLNFEVTDGPALEQRRRATARPPRPTRPQPGPLSLPRCALRRHRTFRHLTRPYSHTPRSNRLPTRSRANHHRRRVSVAGRKLFRT